MIFSPVRAIAIDNNGLELLSIVNGLAALGAPCSAHLYDSGELVPSPPAGGYRHLRLAFLDMNLLDAAGMEVKNMASIIGAVLKKAVARDCGPYSIVFWTTFPEKVDELKPELMRQLELLEVPFPCQITYIGKAEVAPVTNGATAEQANVGLREHFEAQAALGPKLEATLKGTLAKSGSASVVSAWETLLAESASNTFSELFAEARKISRDGADDAFSNILATIAVESIGKKNAREEPLMGVTEGLLELVVDHLRSSESSTATAAVIESELKPRIQRGPADLPFDTVSRMNKLFQVDRLGSRPATSIPRGVVLRPSDDFLRKAGLDEEWAAFLWREILHDPLRLSGSDSRRSPLLARKAEVAGKVRPLLVEVGADCDHAQRKPRSHRFLIAAEVPTDCIAEFLESSEVGRRSSRVSDAIEVFGPWPSDDSKFALAICCKRFFSRQADVIPHDCTPIMRLRGAIVNHLLHRYSTLSTRPGFVSLGGSVG